MKTIETQKINVLIACEESQAECMAFRNLGFNAFSCDIQKCSKKGNPDWHIVGDVTPLLKGKTCFTTQSGKENKVPRWDLIIAHPPCTYLCKIGSYWLYKEPDTAGWIGNKYRNYNSARVNNMIKARSFFMECLNACANFIAVENPIPMKIAKLPKADFYACPSWYGAKYTKKTYYWVKNLPPLMAEIISSKTKCLVHCSRGKYRSRTYPGLAKAVAKQWGDYVINHL